MRGTAPACFSTGTTGCFRAVRAVGTGAGAELDFLVHPAFLIGVHFNYFMDGYLVNTPVDMMQSRAGVDIVIQCGLRSKKIL